MATKLFKKPIKTLATASLLAMSAVMLSACGNENNEAQVYRSQETESNNNFKPLEFDFELPERKSSLVTPPAKPGRPAPAKSALTTNIKSLSVLIDEERDLATSVTVQFKNIKNALVFKLNGLENEVQSESRDYSLEYKCTNYACEKAWFYIKEHSTALSIEVQYERTVKFFDKLSLAKIKVSDKDKTLLKEAGEYGFPIIHEQSIVSLGATLDVLTIRRPELDIEYDDEAEDPANGNPPAQEAQLLVIELENTTKPISPKPQPQAQIEKQNTVQAPSVVPVKQTIIVTEDPTKAFNIKLPSEFFRKGFVVTGNFNIKDHFSIVPAELEDPTEPAYRLFVVAEEFHKQQIKILQGACNYFVRSVMIVAGYSEMGKKNFNANSFHHILKGTVEHDLNRWENELVNFTEERASAQRAYLETEIAKIPDRHAVIVQTIRQGRHGHVAFLAPVDGKLMKIDVSIDTKNRQNQVPRAREVKGEQLLNGIFRNNTVHSAPGLRPKTRRIST
jgi:hypothetical protein